MPSRQTSDPVPDWPSSGLTLLSGLAGAGRALLASVQMRAVWFGVFRKGMLMTGPVTRCGSRTVWHGSHSHTQTHTHTDARDSCSLSGIPRSAPETRESLSAEGVFEVRFVDVGAAPR